jgi:hypothetical protein
MRSCKTDVPVGIIFASQLSPLPVVAMLAVGVPSASIVTILFVRQRRRCLASEDGSSSGGIDLLHALLAGGFAGGGSSLVGLDAGDVVGIVDVP